MSVIMVFLKYLTYFCCHWPNKTKIKIFSGCHSNNDSFVAYSIYKLDKIEACNSNQNYHFICTSEFYLNLSTSANPSNSKLCGICLYYKKSLDINVISSSLTRIFFAKFLLIIIEVMLLSSFYIISTHDRNKLNSLQTNQV